MTEPAGGLLGARLPGTWRLVSIEARDRDDEGPSHPWGTDVDGRLMYDDRGRMSLQMMRLPRQLFASDDLGDGTLGEVKAAFESYHGYYGAYEVDEGGATVVHRIEGSSFPNWIGQEQLRQVAIEGDLLTMTSPPIPFSGRNERFVSLWRKLG